MRGRPVTDEDHADVIRLHGEGLSRNAICKQIGRSGRVVSRIAEEHGLTFERGEQIAAATEAKKIDAAARRAELQLGSLDAANRLLGQMFAPTKVFNFGGKENDYNERQHDEPPFRDKRDIAVALQALATTALRLAEYDKATGDEGDKSTLVDLMSQLKQAWNEASPPAESDPK